MVCTKRSSRRRLSLMLVVAVAATLLPGCRRSQEQPTTDTTAQSAAQEPTVEVPGLALPQSNSRLSISLTSVPEAHVVTYNDDGALEVTDARRPDLRYNFEADLAQSPSRGPSSSKAFETFVRKFNDGKLLDSGTFETALGETGWVSGSYFEEDESFTDVRIFAPHPSGSGTLIVWSVSPADIATVEERLTVMRELLAGVS